MSDFNQQNNDSPQHSGTVHDFSDDRTGHETAHFDAAAVEAITAQAAEKIDTFELEDGIDPPLLVRVILPTMFVPAENKDDFFLTLMAGRPQGWQAMLGRIVGYVVEAKREENEFVNPGTGEVQKLESIWLRGGFKATCYIPPAPGAKLRSFKSARCILPKGAGELIEETLLRDPVSDPSDAPEFDIDIGVQKFKSRQGGFFQWIAPSHYSADKSMDKRLQAIERRRPTPLEGFLAMDKKRALPTA